MSDTIEVCPWTISVGNMMSDTGVAMVRVNVCNQERGEMVVFADEPGRAVNLAGPIMDYVAVVERASKYWCFAAWDKNVDELKAAMVERGAPFAPGYCVDVPVIVRK